MARSTRTRPRTAPSMTKLGFGASLLKRQRLAMEAEKSGTTSAPEQAMSDSWLYKITTLPGSTKFPVDEDGEMTTKTAGEIATQDDPCGGCDGHPYLGAWGHTEADCNLSVDDNGDLKRCVICETNFRTRDKPKFCEQCGLAFHAKCMDASASGRCQLCTVTDSPETAPTQPTPANFETPAKPKGATRQQPVDVEADEDEAPGAPSKSMLDARARLAPRLRANRDWVAWTVLACSTAPCQRRLRGTARAPCRSWDETCAAMRSLHAGRVQPAIQGHR